MLDLIINRELIKVDWLEFSDGAITCTVEPLQIAEVDYLTISVDPVTPVKQIIEELNLLKDALERQNVKIFSQNKANLYLPYLPYGRADRVFLEGNPLPLEVFLLQLDKIGFKKIYLVDPHSKAVDFNKYSFDVSIKAQLTCLVDSVFVGHPNWDYVVCPDAGAILKSKIIAEYYNIPVIYAKKIRCKFTGKILSINLTSTVKENSRVLIADDILDGGGTFIPLAEELKAQSCTIDLYVTHMIASKGLSIFKNKIDKIFCFHTVGTKTDKHQIARFNQGKI